MRRPVLHQHAKFHVIGQIAAGVSILQFFRFSRYQPQQAGIFESLTIRSFFTEAISITLPNFIKVSPTVAEIWQSNGLQNGSRSPSWIFEIQIF